MKYSTRNPGNYAAGRGETTVVVAYEGNGPSIPIGIIYILEEQHASFGKGWHVKIGLPQNAFKLSETIYNKASAKRAIIANYEN